MLITLPFPPADLSPNARLHHHAKARAVKRYRALCWGSALAQGARKMPGPGAEVSITFHPPRRGMDADNMVARFKAGQDAVADAIGIDDRRWRVTYAFAEPGRGGAVEIEIQPSSTWQSVGEVAARLVENMNEKA